jgi:hypothetical protein
MHWVQKSYLTATSSVQNSFVAASAWRITHTGVNIIFFRVIHTICPMSIQFRVGEVHKPVLCVCEFCEKRYNRSHALPSEISYICT